jgi:tRNA(adenine34) deaminase
MLSEEDYMRLAIAEAASAAEAGDVPVGALVVDADGEVVGRGRNRRELDHDPSAHAEIVALREAGARRSSWRLHGAVLFATLEPCPMCAGALVNARVRRVYFGCDDPKAGAVRTLYTLLDDKRLNHRVEVVAGVLGAESSALLRGFFSRLRR